jgi:hypothetical protein
MIGRVVAFFEITTRGINVIAVARDPRPDLGFHARASITASRLQFSTVAIKSTSCPTRSKNRLNLLPASLRKLVSKTSLPHPDPPVCFRLPSVLGCDMELDGPFARLVDESFREIALIRFSLLPRPAAQD